MFKIVMMNQIQLTHKYVSVIRNCVMMNVMIAIQDLDLMDSNATNAIQKIHGVMILMKILNMEMMP